MRGVFDGRARHHGARHRRRDLEMAAVREPGETVKNAGGSRLRSWRRMAIAGGAVGDLKSAIDCHDAS